MRVLLGAAAAPLRRLMAADLWWLPLLLLAVLIGGFLLWPDSSPHESATIDDLTYEEMVQLLEESMAELGITPIPTQVPDSRYKGCHLEVQAFQAAMLNSMEDPAVLYLAGESREGIEEEYFKTLDTLGQCLGGQLSGAQ